MNLHHSGIKLFCMTAGVAAAMACVVAGGQPAWRPATAPLMTRWAAAVGPTNALPDYPRPQLVRSDWLNLNGLWDYAITPDSDELPSSFTGEILVPFPVESALSGVMTHFDEHSKIWYHRTFSVPKSWRGQQVRLHFGAVDWRCEIWVNGRKIGQHQGGYDAFTFDVTDALHWQEPETILVGVTDPTEGDQPRGKQSRKPEGIFYTSVSGIWQTVWLEPLPRVCIESLKTVPAIDTKSLHLRVSANSLSPNLQVHAVALAGGREVAHVAGPANTELSLSLPDVRLWSPNDPFLYDLRVTLEEDGRTLDSATSYFGMRKVSLNRKDDGYTQIELNNLPVFQVGLLDQGFWPDGIYTAPTDEALRSDLNFMKQAGFNLIRKHVKVEPERWYYWCDKLGLLVWQDMPSGNNATPEGRHDFEDELSRMVDGLDNHPCIIVWVLFNEGWGQYDTEPLTAKLKKMDPSRLVDNASGWTDMHVGDLNDMHNYPGPNVPAADPQRASVLGETGGFGLVVPGHVWSSRSWGYVMLAGHDELAAHYNESLRQLWRLHNLRGLSAAIYTQTTDVETECNGLMTYDRAVIKVDPEILAEANRGSNLVPAEKIILPNALFGRPEWKYTVDQPGDDWCQPDFDASSWKQGIGGFGSEGTPGLFANTSWTTADIWLRRGFTLDTENISGMKLQLFHDEDVEVYLNGLLALKLAGYITDYDEFEIPPAVIKTLHPGENTIAVHCHQTTGGQGVDVGLVIPQPGREQNEKP